MNSQQTFGQLTLSIFFAATASGCASAPMTETPQVMGGSLLKANAHYSERTWMNREASGGDLLYVSDGDQNVFVYSYPSGQLVGTLTGFVSPLGECVDSAGNVFIVAATDKSYKSSTIYEFAHGGTSPIATLQDPNRAVGCAVDPSSGNLAVSGGGVALFLRATGVPIIYPSSEYVFYYCGYDKHGNLYLSAFEGPYANQDVLVRLSNGSSTFEQISLNANLYSSSIFWPSVQWDGKHMTVSSASNGGRGPVSIYRLSISGSDASIVGTTTLTSKKNRYSGQLWIQGKAVVGLDYFNSIESASRWAYPRGGRPRQKIAVLDGDIFWGTTISRAASR